MCVHLLTLLAFNSFLYRYFTFTDWQCKTHFYVCGASTFVWLTNIATNYPWRNTALKVHGSLPKEVVFPTPSTRPAALAKTVPSSDIEASGPVSRLMGKLSRPLYSLVGQRKSSEQDLTPQCCSMGLFFLIGLLVSRPWLLHIQVLLLCGN